jgi:MFS family permease
MIGESYSADAQAHMMAYMSLAWGVGAILGPAVGGALSQPCAGPSSSGGQGSAAGVCGPGGLLVER